jgi:hypothetical protein
VTDCTERHTTGRAYGLDGEGHEGTPGQHSVTDCTERHPTGRGTTKGAQS